jgi:hypothetical protein
LPCLSFRIADAGKLLPGISALAREMFGNAGRGGHDAKSFECASDANQPMVL